MTFHHLLQLLAGGFFALVAALALAGIVGLLGGKKDHDEVQGWKC